MAFRVLPVTPLFLQQLEQSFAPQSRAQLRQLREELTESLEPLLSAPATAEPSSYRNMLEKLGDSPVSGLLRLAVLEGHSVARSKLGDSSIDAALLRRTVDSFLDVEGESSANSAALCAAAFVALDRGEIATAQRLLARADRELLRTPALSTAQLPSELHGFSPTAEIVASIRMLNPELVERKSRPFAAGDSISDSDAAKTIAELARRITINVLLRSSDHQLSSSELSDAIRAATGLPSTLSYEYAKSILAAHESSEAIAELRSSVAEDEHALFN